MKIFQKYNLYNKTTNTLSGNKKFWLNYILMRMKTVNEKKKKNNRKKPNFAFVQVLLLKSKKFIQFSEKFK